jgi:flagellar hook-associated protein 3 FlgL
MRVTDKAMFDQAAVRANAARGRLEQALERASTGLKVEHPWDDPGATGPIVGHLLAQKRLEAVQTVAGRAVEEIAATDNALGDITEAVSRARQVAVQLGNETYSAADRLGAAADVRQLWQHSLALLNTQVGNRFIFGGHRDATQPFDTTGAYQGDTGVRQLEILPGVLQSVSLRADQLIKGVGGGVDVLQTLSDLATALETNNTENVRASLTNLDAAIGQLSLGRAQAGAQMNSLDTAILEARRQEDDETAALSRLTDADIFAAGSELALAQRALEAAITASARSFDFTLLNKLR